MKYKNITRLDGRYKKQGRGVVTGWQVRVTRQGRQHTKLFSDRKCGGEKAALQAAIAYRDSLKKDLPAPATPAKGQLTGEMQTKGIKLGVIGLSVRPVKSGVHEIPCFVSASFKREGGEKKRTEQKTGIVSRGVRPALFLACRKLAVMRAEFYGHPRDWALKKTTRYFNKAFPIVSRVLADYIEREQAPQGGQAVYKSYQSAGPVLVEEFKEAHKS